MEKNMNYIWCDDDEQSEMSQALVQAKQRNDTDFWSILRKTIDHDVQTLPLNSFRRWASVAIVPLANNSRMHVPITSAITVAKDDDNVKNALTEEWIGIDKDSLNYYKIFDDAPYSAHRCYNMDHLLNYDLYNSISNLLSYDTIVEVGGGYGDMCAIIHKLGFEGKYYIFDFPEILKLQKYYLDRLGYSYVKYVTDINDLPHNVDFVVGTWSFSEIPLELRNELLDHLWKARHWLISYQNEIFGVNNNDYFIEKFQEKDYAIEEIEYMPFDGGNNYLIV
jgi:putative sugar O-methyltransferase